MEDFIIERINNNNKNFNKEELTFIQDNAKLIYKIYLMGLLDNLI